MRRESALRTAIAIVATLGTLHGQAQTTAGTSATIVVPLIAQTGSFGSEVTVYNPNAGAVTVDAAFYDAQNTDSPGLKPCTSLVLSAGGSAQFSIATQCALPAVPNFGLLILSEQTGAQRFYGYARTQTPHGVGFSTEGFPIENFNDQLQHATGLKRLAASAGVPAFQTNCFVGTLGDAVNYELRLFDGTTNAQLGGTLAGTLGAFQQFRYLDVFVAAGVPAGDRSNVRAQFTNLTGAGKRLIGFCTVQENQNFSADFRIAKSFGGTPQNAFVQGGNAFGTTALLGTSDNHPLDIDVNGQRVMRFEPNANGPNVIGGHPDNKASPQFNSQTIAGGGIEAQCFISTRGGEVPCTNETAQRGATVGGGYANLASGDAATVAGGSGNAATNVAATVAGGSANVASGGFAAIGGGSGNVASGSFSIVAGGASSAASADHSFAAGRRAKATTTGSFIWADSRNFDFQPSVSNFFGVRATGGVGLTVAINATTGAVTQFCNLLPGVASWQCTSDRNAKENFAIVDARRVLEQLVAMPLSTWNFKGADPRVRLLGPIAQDFHAAFGLGNDDKTIVDTNLHGVALAAVQGLHQIVQANQAQMRAVLADKDEQIRMQRLEVAALRERLAELEGLRGEVSSIQATLRALRDAPPRLAANGANAAAR
jgi:hypothetical protein